MLVAFVTLANLRGVKEAGSLFAIPTYGFVLMIAVVWHGVGLAREGRITVGELVTVYSAVMLLTYPLRHFEEIYRPVVHPVVRVHPLTGKKSIFVNPQFTIGIKDMDERVLKDVLVPMALDEADPKMAMLWQISKLHEQMAGQAGPGGPGGPPGGPPAGPAGAGPAEPAAVRAVRGRAADPATLFSSLGQRLSQQFLGTGGTRSGEQLLHKGGTELRQRLAHGEPALRLRQLVIAHLDLRQRLLGRGIDVYARPTGSVSAKHTSDLPRNDQRCVWRERQ